MVLTDLSITYNENSVWTTIKSGDDINSAIKSTLKAEKRNFRQILLVIFTSITDVNQQSNTLFVLDVLEM